MEQPKTNRGVKSGGPVGIHPAAVRPLAEVLVKPFT